MGFFDSFKKGYQEETEHRAERQQYSRYKSMEEEERENLSRKSDAELMREYKTASARGDADKCRMIGKALEARGLFWDQRHGRFDRR